MEPSTNYSLAEELATNHVSEHIVRMRVKLFEELNQTKLDLRGCKTKPKATKLKRKLSLLKSEFNSWADL